MRLGDFKALSFDCYGTLIDWERGLLGMLRPWLGRHGVAASDDEVLEVYADCEHECQASMAKAPYPVILARVHAMLGEHYAIPSEVSERDAFAASIGSWPPFPDTAEALQYLKRRFKLIILSNVDNASFSKSERAMGTKFDAVYTAEIIGSYKPSLNNFRYL
ncbi:MAG TPA: HAD family hydrolase, partial [Sphingomonadales bacterium]|nr:HAD family hydrolase [Sphingomonadales bacterium]